MTTALLGYGAIFAMESEDSPNTYTPFDEITNITPPSDTIDQIDVTHMQSPNRRREFISGLIDGGECAIEMNYVPDNDTDQRILYILSLGVGVSRVRSFQITYQNGVTDTFDAEIQGFERAVPVDAQMTATVTLKVTGELVRGQT